MEQVLIQRIGARLRQEREQQGLSLEQVATTTRISRTHLDNLEQGELARLPEPIYVQGFINRYARCLNLDPGRLRQEASRRLETPAAPPPPPVAAEPPEPTPAVAATPAAPTPSAPTAASLGRNLNWLKGAIAAVAIAGIGVAAWQQLSQRRPAPEAPTTIATQPATPTTPPPKPAVNPNQAEISSSGPAWIALTVDGQDLPDRMLKPDQPLTLTVKKTLRIRPGRPDLVTVQLGDRRQSPLGDISAIRWYEFAVQP